ncbi:unnamed protein product, partial [marine sediment metagenome]
PVPMEGRITLEATRHWAADCTYTAPAADP